MAIALYSEPSATQARAVAGVILLCSSWAKQITLTVALSIQEETLLVRRRRATGTENTRRPDMGH